MKLFVMASALVLVFFATCAWAGDVSQDNTVGRGAQIRLTKSGMKFLADIEVKALQTKVKNLRLPDQGGGGSHFTFTASNVVIKYLAVASQSFTTIPNVGLRLAIGGITLPVSGYVRAKYKRGWVKVSASTNVDVRATGMSLTLDIKFDAVKGKPHVSLARCSAHIDDIHLHFHGGVAWLLNLVKGLLESKMKKILTEQICKQGGKLVNENFNKALQDFPVRTVIKDFAYVDYSLEQPLFTKDFADFYMRGEFMSLKHPVHSKLRPPQFETTSSSSKMLYIWLTDYSLNTAAEVFDDSKMLQRIFKLGDKIPEGMTKFMNTTTLKEFIPKLYETYPDRPIQIDAATFKAPRFELHSGAAGVGLYVRAAFNVVLETKTLVPVFYIDLSVTGNVTASIKTVDHKVNICGSITSFKFKLAIGGSVIGEVHLPVEHEGIERFVRGIVVDQANPILNKGFPLPQSSHLILRDTELTLIKNAIRVDANADYHI